MDNFSHLGIAGDVVDDLGFFHADAILPEAKARGGLVIVVICPRTMDRANTTERQRACAHNVWFAFHVQQLTRDATNSDPRPGLSNGTHAHTHTHDVGASLVVPSFHIRDFGFCWREQLSRIDQKQRIRRVLCGQLLVCVFDVIRRISSTLQKTFCPSLLPQAGQRKCSASKFVGRTQRHTPKWSRAHSVQVFADFILVQCARTHLCMPRHALWGVGCGVWGAHA